MSNCETCNGAGVVRGTELIVCKACVGTGNVLASTCDICHGTATQLVSIEVLCTACSGSGHRVPLWMARPA
jgi:DnaJ-class molecular chaperone